MSYAPLTLSIPLAAVLLLFALPSGMTAYRGWTSRLDRLGRLGLHTPAANESDTAFTVANRVAAPLVAGAATVGVLCAVLVLALPLGVAGAIVIAAVGAVGIVLQLAAASRIGEQAAMTVPRRARKSEGGGCCGSCGCDSPGGAGCQNAGGRNTGGPNTDGPNAGGRNTGGRNTDGSNTDGPNTGASSAASGIPDLVADATSSVRL